MLEFTIKNNLDEVEEQFLKENFTNTCLSFGISNNKSEELYDYVCFEYSDWNRHYHNLSHIFSLLKLREVFSVFFNKKNHVDLAIWFHDIVYNCKFKDNEIRSLNLFKELMDNRINYFDLEYVSKLILSTEKHLPKLPQDIDNQLFLDLDLSILAAKKNDFKKYREGIMEEYMPCHSFSVFNSGRLKVLNKFLDRESIYFSDLFKEKFEKTARENILWEISDLKGE